MSTFLVHGEIIYKARYADRNIDAISERSNQFQINFFLLFRPYFFSCIMTSRLLKGLVPTVNRLRVCPPRFSVFRPIIPKRNFIATIPRWTSGEGFYSNYFFKAFQ